MSSNMQSESATKSDDEDEGDDGSCMPASGNLVARAKWLRKQTAKCRKDEGSVREIHTRLLELSLEDAAFVVQDCNRNGKGALHFASQIRGGDADAPELIRLLVSLRADVNASIKRGHTALIFASSRGHSDVVDLLLDLGANPLVVTVCGETAAKVGRGRLAERVQARLDAAEAVALTSSWRNFQDVPDAQEAEMLWESNAAKRSKRMSAALQDEAARSIAQNVLSADLSVTLQQAIEVQQNRALLELLMKSMADGFLPWVAVSQSLRSAMSKVLRREGAQNLRSCFSTFQEHGLLNTLQIMGHRDRRSICAILRALIEEVRSPDSLQLVTNMSVSDVIENAEPYMAAEVLMVRTNLSESDMQSIERLLNEIVEDRTRGLSIPEVLNISCHMFLEKYSIADLAAAPAVNSSRVGKVSKKHGLFVAEWLHILQFASHVRFATTLWPKLVHVVAVAAATKKMSDLLLRVAKADVIKLAGEVIQALAVSLVDAGNESARIASITQPGFEHADTAQLPAYELSLLPEWIDTEEQLLKLRTELESMVEASATLGQLLLIGVDTEWGCVGTSPSESTIAVLQIAAGERVWVVDCLKRSRTLGLLVKWLRDNESVQILGFAFLHDAEKLTDLLPIHDRTVGQFGKKTVDVQELAMRHLPLGQVPGLKAVSEIWLGKTLDKSYQCSDWNRRPLLDAQLAYAAADAAVLLDLAKTMGFEPDTGLIEGG